MEITKGLILVNQHGGRFEILGETMIHEEIHALKPKIPGVLLKDLNNEEILSVYKNGIDKSYSIEEPLIFNLKDDVLSQEELLEIIEKGFLKLSKTDIKEKVFKNPKFNVQVHEVVNYIVDTYVNHHYVDSNKILHENTKKNLRHFLICFFIMQEVYSQKK